MKRINILYIIYFLFKIWMLILVLFCENERQEWDASRYIKARSEAKRFYVYRDASHLWRIHIWQYHVLAKYTQRICKNKIGSAGNAQLEQRNYFLLKVTGVFHCAPLFSSINIRLLEYVFTDEDQHPKWLKFEEWNKFYRFR